MDYKHATTAAPGSSSAASGVATTTASIRTTSDAPSPFTSTSTAPVERHGRTPEQRAGKQVTFELVLPFPARRARLPMRVYIYPHDTTEAIITTTKNFYGLYHPTASVSFEDKDGNTIVAAYANFQHLMTVYVHSTDPAVCSDHHLQLDCPQDSSRPAPDEAGAPKRPRLDPALFSRRRAAKFDSSELPLFVPSQVSLAADRSTSRPAGPAGPAGSANPVSQSGLAAKNSALTGQLPSPQSGSALSVRRPVVGPVRSVPSRSSSGSGGPTLSTPAPSLSYGSTISDEDVALQLMRLGEIAGTTPASRPFVGPAIHAWSARSRSLSPSPADCLQKPPRCSRSRSPQVSAPDPDAPSDLESMLAHDDGYRSSCSESYSDDESDSLDGADPAIEPDRSPTGSRPKSSGKLSLSTPAPSAVISSAPASVLSSRAEPTRLSAVPPTRQPTLRVLASKWPTSAPAPIPISQLRTAPHAPIPADSATVKLSQVSPSPARPRRLAAGPAPQSLAALSASVPSGQASCTGGGDHEDEDEDLSTKPRCQRCRKSKKGCDRQRPCRRCRDAGIGIDGCISEEEGNGRKGRYGRFMGVGVKKAAAAAEATVSLTVPPTVALAPAPIALTSVPDSKKRKR